MPRSWWCPTTGRCRTFGKIDAAIWTLEQAGALARAHPGITAVVPKDLGSPFFLTYLMPPESEEMVHFVNYWLELRKADGLRAREVSYWILGQSRKAAAPRWSVLRDVLHWTDCRPTRATARPGQERTGGRERPRCEAARRPHARRT